MNKPYINEHGEMVVGFDCPARYKWWIKGGLSIEKILDEIGASDTIKEKYLCPHRNTGMKIKQEE